MLVEVGYQLLETMSKHDVDVTSQIDTRTHLEDAINESAQQATGCLSGTVPAAAAAAASLR